jgi:hypothetical protein
MSDRAPLDSVHINVLRRVGYAALELESVVREAELLGCSEEEIRRALAGSSKRFVQP